MNLPLVDRIGDWNPQLLREIKGKDKWLNMPITFIVSFVIQSLLFVFNNTEVDKFFWSTWYEFCLVLLGGISLLITDLDKEEKRGTLNFLRLSPQGSEKIIIGKLLGVPILIYFAAFSALPFHFYSGLRAHIPLHNILLLDVVIISSLICSYLAAMLFGFVTNWLGNFHYWLAMGFSFMYLMITTSGGIYNNGADFFNILSPILTLRYITFPHLNYEYNLDWIMRNHQKLEWFYQPIGHSLITTVAASILSSALISYWLFQGLKRRFYGQNTTILSKGQSYLFTASLQIAILGFALQTNSQYQENFWGLFIVNFLLFMALIVALTPNYQTLQNWAQSRHTLVKKHHRSGVFSLTKDLMFGEKSPGSFALVINLIIADLLLTPWALMSKGFALLPMIFTINLTLLYEAVIQLFIFSKIPKSGMWAFITVGAAISLPPILWSSLSISFEEMPVLWLSSTYPLFWGWETSTALGSASMKGILFSILGQWGAIILLNLELTRRLKIAGQSASKALLSGHR